MDAERQYVRRRLQGFSYYPGGRKKAAKFSGEDGVSPMDITGKPMKGWLKVAADGYEDDAALKLFTKAAIDFVKTLPDKD
jgi:hypothetical protein